MKIGVTGATGLIGSKLCVRARAEGHEVTAFVRDPDRSRKLLPDVAIHRWDASFGPPESKALEGLDGLFHLAGEPIAGGRWTPERKRLIRDSRVLGTRQLVSAISRCIRPPSALISASATGYYGDRGDEELTEESPPGANFLAETAVAWEREAVRAVDFGVRTVLIRSGVVLSIDGGALAKMLTPFRLGLGGPLGSGGQFMSWIHIDDHLAMMRFALDDSAISGPLNATAPQPARNREFTRELGNVLRRPAFIPMPAFALKLIFGEMAQALLLEGQRVMPKRALEAGFEFRFPTLGPALENLLG